MRQEDVEMYLVQTRKIEGWLFPIDAALIGPIDEFQDREGIAGDLFEIGVHHGKSSIFLARLLRDKECLGVCDVFGDQSANLDHSGEGSYELFANNLARFAPAVAKRVRVFAKRSAELTSIDTGEACRIFHIDGGHRPEDVIGDLTTAIRATLPLGVVVVDDVFNPSWPGVGEGLYRFLAKENGFLRPLIVGGNKAFFIATAARSRYEPWLERMARNELLVSRAFAFEFKEWLGTRVLVASRREWVDLAPIAAARVHLPRRSLANMWLSFWSKRN